MKNLKQQSPHSVTLRESGIYVFESRHADAFYMPMGRWPFHKVCCILRGAGCVQTETGTQRIQAGDALFVPRNYPHRFSDETGAAMTLYMACFDGALLREHPTGREALDHFEARFPCAEVVSLEDDFRQRDVAQLLRDMILEQTRDAPGHRVLVACRLQELLIYLVRSIEDFRQRAETAGDLQRAVAGTRDYIDGHFFEPITIPRLAAMAGCSYRRYTTLFKVQTGTTVNTYITRRRIDYACRRLRETGNIASAALEAGFEDLSHFYRVFKKETGTTPARLT